LAGENLAKTQQKDDELGPFVRSLLRQGLPSFENIADTSESTKVLWCQWNRLTVHQGVAYRHFFGDNCELDRLQLLVPVSLREVTRCCHIESTGVHLGRKKTLDQVQCGYFWTTWRADTSSYCRCQKCCFVRCSDCELPQTASMQPAVADSPLGRLCRGWTELQTCWLEIRNTMSQVSTDLFRDPGDKLSDDNRSDSVVGSYAQDKESQPATVLDLTPTE